MSYLIWALLILVPLLLAGLSRSGGAVAGTGRGHLTAMWLLGLIGIATLVVAPHVISFSQKEILVFLVINMLLVASYRLLTLTGEFSLAHVVMMGCGAYGSALCTKLLGIPVPISMLLGAAVAGLIAFVLSFPLFRMKGFYFLIGSFAAGEVIRLLWKRFREPFGGPKGIKLIPEFPSIDTGGIQLEFYEPVTFYYLALVVVAISLLLLWRLEHSRIGLTFHAVHWQDQLADAVGVNTWRYRTLAFVIASVFAGLAGGLLAHYLGTINPNRFDVEEMVYVLIWVIVGGTATIWGPIIGLVALTVINEVALRALDVGEMRPLFYGAILILAMLFLPDGLETLPRRIKHRLARGKATAEPAE
jgi:branched-chain amino acid transport system permease protein